MAILLWDTVPIVRSLQQHDATRPLAKKIERLSSLLSISFDLEQALAMTKFHFSRASELVNSIEDFATPKAISDEEGFIDAALATQIIIWYARCTDTTSDERGRFDPRRFYNDEEIAWHEAIIELRNTAIAHFGAGAHGSGPWAGDQLLLVQDDETERVWFRHKWLRSNYRGQVLAELRILLPKAIAGSKEDIAALQARIFKGALEHHKEWVEAWNTAETMLDDPDAPSSSQTRTPLAAYDFIE